MDSTPTATIEQIETLRDLFLKRMEKENSEDNFHPNDIDRIRTSNRWLKLFIEQCDLNMKQSLNMLWDTCIWRKNYGTNDINENNINLDYIKSGIIYPHNKDIDGKILLILKTKLHTKGTRNIDELIKCLVYWIERLQKQTDYDQLTLFFDMQSSGLSNMDMDFTRRIIDTFKLYYPCSLNYIIIFEMPWALTAAFKIIKTLLPPKAVARMKFVNTKTMKEFINEDMMLRSWGGTDDYEFKFEPIEKLKNQQNGQITNISSSNNNNNNNNNTSMVTKKVHFANPSPPESPMSAGAGDRAASGVGDVELLRITPDDVITFKKSGNELSGSVEIANISQNTITYKVKTTSPEKFRVRPSYGVLLPGANTTIYVCVQKGQELSTSNKDKFLVMGMPINDDLANNNPAITELWKNTSANSSNVEQHRLKCTLPHSGNSNDNIVNGCLNSNGFGGMDADRQINNFNTKLSQLTEKADKLQQQIKKTQRLQIITLIFFLFITTAVAIMFKDDILDRKSCFSRI